MKKHVWSLWTLATVFLFSCTNDDFDAGKKKEGMVDFTIKTSIPKGITTYASENGGAANVDASDYDLRYILEAWTKENPKRLAYRAYQIVPDNFTTTDVTFSARLLALEYDFVFWADFVTEGTTEATAASADLYYKTNNGKTEIEIKADPTVDPGLTAIEMQTSPAYGVSNDARDAFYKTTTVDLTQPGQSVSSSITLNRPFGKYRLISDQVSEGFLSDDIATTEIEYIGTTSGELPAGFNALTGEVNTNVTISVSGKYVTTLEARGPVTVGSTTYPDALVLGFDYIFAAPAQTLTLKVSSYDQSHTLIAFRELPNIPILENKLTTVVGNFYTNTGTFNVIVSDDFDNDETAVVSQEIVVERSGAELGRYASIADAASVATAPGDIINVPAGIYTLPANGIVLHAGVTLQGAGKDATILRYPSSSSNNGAAINLAGGSGESVGTTLKDVWVLYDTDRKPGTAWGPSERISGVIFANRKYTTPAQLLNSRISGFRQGVYGNDADNFIISNNETVKNRYNFQFVNTSAEVITNNVIKESETIGILFITSVNSPRSNTQPTITGNTFIGNWYCDVEVRHGDRTRPIGDVKDNTFTDIPLTIMVGETSSLTPSSGSFAKDFQANVVTNDLAEVSLTGATVLP